MPCLAALIALIAPRLTIAVLWILTGWFRGMFDNLLWPILGFLFLPTTLLWYSAVQHWFGGEWTLWPIVGLVVSLMIDLSPASSKRTRKEGEPGGLRIMRASCCMMRGGGASSVLSGRSRSTQHAHPPATP